MKDYYNLTRFNHDSFSLEITDEVDIDKLDKSVTLVPGERVKWYYKSEKEFWEEEFADEGVSCKQLAEWEGILIPRPGVEQSTPNTPMDVENTVVVMINHPAEKCYPETDWLFLDELLANNQIVEVLHHE